MQKTPNSLKDTTKFSITANCAPQKFDINTFFKDSMLNVDSIDYNADGIVIHVSCPLPNGICPYCGSVSDKVHSTYVRHPADLPILGRNVRLNARMRKFFCKNESCRYKTFAEQPGNELFRHRRRTRRCEGLVYRAALSQSSESASAELTAAGVAISGSSVLRDLHRLNIPASPEVSSVGVDDWAKRKGFDYGSILVDLESGRPLGLLEDRDSASFGQWLEKHTAVGVVSRDRATSYSSAVAATGRNIMEVADRFHLYKNMSDLTDTVVSLHYGDYAEAARSQECKDVDDSAHADRRLGYREGLFNEAKALQREGLAPNEAAKRLGIAPQTAKKYYRVAVFQPPKPKNTLDYTMVDEMATQALSYGEKTSAVYRKAVELGFQGSSNAFRYHYRHLISGGHHGKCNAGLMPIKALKRAIGKFIGEEEMTQKEYETIQTLRSFKWFNEISLAAKSFYGLFETRSVKGFKDWIRHYSKSGEKNILSFVEGIKADFKAVANCILNPSISNGIVEGFVNKLKLIKRIMYGKAKIPLLEKKLVMPYLLFN